LNGLRTRRCAYSHTQCETRDRPPCIQHRDTAGSMRAASSIRTRASLSGYVGIDFVVGAGASWTHPRPRCPILVTPCGPLSDKPGRQNCPRKDRPAPSPFGILRYWHHGGSRWLRPRVANATLNTIRNANCATIWQQRTASSALRKVVSHLVIK
jgi:hypothetical protein